MSYKQDDVDVPVSVFLELFLTRKEKDVFSTWNEQERDLSISGFIIGPITNWIAKFVPNSVAPNVLTIAGVLAIMQAWWFCEEFSDDHPRIVAAASVLSIIVFWVLGRVDGKHARRIMNDTPLGELFKYVTDTIGTNFLVVLMCRLLLETEDLDKMWYCVQTMQLVMLLKHWSAFNRHAGMRYLFVGPGELMTIAACLLIVRAVFGIEPFFWWYDFTWGLACSIASERFGLDANSYVGSMNPARAAYLSIFYITIFRIGTSSRRDHSWTRKSLVFILLLRGLSAWVRLDMLTGAKTTQKDVIFDGLFWSMVTSDLIVAKMADRQIHTWVVLMATTVVVPHLQFLILCFVCVYYVAVFGDIMNHLNMPLLQSCKNVYCDGIYDLCHIGHKNLFRHALSYGNRLFVGVIGDEDANNYKRPPIMSAAEREAEVSNCKCVSKVIRNAPCFGLTEEFIRKHQIHVVAFGQEYLDRYPNPDDDPYYKVPRKNGIAIPMPRTQSLSTSDLIRRIQNEDVILEKKSAT